MNTNGITQYIDVAQLALYAFWVFFAALIWYLRREDKREGYPLESDRSGSIVVKGYPEPPAPKTFRKAHGGEYSAPNDRPERDVAARPVAAWPGAPLEPTGNPLADGVGPASWASRADEPDLSVDGSIKIRPLRLATDFHLDAHDPDPIGMNVVAADGAVAGKVCEVWVDRSESLIRFYEAEIPGGRHVLVPFNFTKVGGGAIRVVALGANLFAGIPATRSADQITLLEEEKIYAYFGGGSLYGLPGRTEPLI